MSNLWSWPEISQALLDQALQGPDVQRIAFDSRQIEPGDLFFALAGDPGQRFNPSQRSTVDGHDYLLDAQANGAVGAVVQRRIAECTLPQIVVADTYDALWQLGKAARQRLAEPVVAVTGSSGKTTAKRFLTDALDAYAPPGSFNNHIGVPLSLANATIDASAWVFEVGTNHPGEIDPLTALVRPHCAILLNVHNAHIENFPSREALIAEKCAIFGHMQGAGLCIAEDTLGLAGYRFGFSPDSHAQILHVGADLLELQLFGRKLQARLPGGGEHRALTLAAVILATELLGVDLAAALALDDDTVPSGRGNLMRCAGIDLIDDSYNANPASMQAALQAFGQKPASGRKFVLLGEMLELGEISVEAHQTIFEATKAFDGCFLVGAGFAELRGAGNAHHSDADSMLIDRLLETLQPGDSLLIKGSNRVFWATGFVQQLAQALRGS